MTLTLEELSKDAFVIRGFASHDECDAWNAANEERGFEAATFGGSTGSLVKAVRDNDRIVEDARELTDALWARLEPLLPARWKARSMLERHAIGPHELVGLNERVRWYRYEGTQRFHPHVDKPFVGRDGRVSCHTILLYLSDDLEGGATRVELTKSEQVKIAPERGLLLCFDHRLMHEGMPLVRGTKYVLRTDLMWRKR